jgi:hypothetical protein
MRIIAPIAIAGIVLIDVLGGIPTSSVGGPLTLLMISVIAMLAVGVHEAWASGRGIGGWILNIILALAGGIAGAFAASLILEAMLPYLHLEGSLATSRHPMRYVSTGGMMLLVLAGAWGALQIANRVR